MHEEIPKVPRSALATIHGRVKVAVRVTVDASGTVVNDTLTDPGPSKYFARVAAQAARKWKFSPAAGKASRQWLVRFEFSRGGTTAHATQRS
jgi:TonB family protein